ncbi:hypothetical protein AVEN_101998-1 [Araneus ventricosus]|uniref:Uncharacterized protein n=1 Tax=Araneus ventricosus TaxID=182803 RepID=A0A4Y2I8P2_ARAVE|nr:hypothetical protein AVEN_101998-1 [Araneus ventricosus]
MYLGLLFSFKKSDQINSNTENFECHRNIRKLTFFSPHGVPWPPHGIPWPPHGVPWLPHSVPWTPHDVPWPPHGVPCPEQQNVTLSSVNLKLN